jgi:15-cis-phytoene synthase
MSVQAYPWERSLLALAHEALEHHRTRSGAGEGEGTRSSPMLQEAYRYCEALTRSHSRTFYLASGLLPPEKRRAMRALYAFCRVTDDLVDGDPQASRGALESWRAQAFASHVPAGNPVALAWADTRARYNIPRRFGEQLVDGVAQDLEQKRYERFEDLATYCYRVASTVGLMAMHIIGFSGVEAIPYAIRLGVALQLTNILRDVGEDWRAGRLYLPRQELCGFGLGEGDLAAGRADRRWQAFLRFQVARNHRLYQEALPGIALLDRDGRLAVTAAAELYRGILTDIEAHQGDVFRRRAFVGTAEKLRRLPGIWLKSRRQVIDALPSSRAG